jgi:4-amino-4-deoxy-L-arabinose transferase-like glycosyltransferase
MSCASNQPLTSLPPQLLILLALALPYFINLDKSSLWDGNETFYAETPREMLLTGNYLAPMFNYEPRPQKPPLTYWLVLLGYKAVGIQELGVRLPVALAMVGTLLFTYGISRLLFSARAGLWSAAILATTLRLFVLARKLPIDVLLLFWLAGTAYFFVRSVEKKSLRDCLLAYLFAGFGFMTKGPVAWAIPGLSFLIWSLWARRFKFASFHPWAGALILTAVVVPWYFLTYLHYGWTYIADFFMKDNLARFATEIRGPVRGPFFYFGVFMGDFFPWSLLSVAAGIYLWVERKSLRAQNSISFGFPLIWCGVTFVLFSVSKNKQEYYIAPLYPLAAALLAGIIEKTLGAGSALSDRMRIYWRISLIAVACVFVALGILSPFLLPAFLLEAPAVLNYAPAMLMLFMAAILLWQVSRRRLMTSMVAAAGTMWLVFVLAGAAYLPALEPLRPVKGICRMIQAEAAAGDEIGYYRAAVPSMVFYLRRPIFSISDPPTMRSKFEGANRVFCVLGDRDYRYFRDNCKVELYVLSRNKQLPTQLRLMLGKESPTGEGEELLIVSNQPARVTINLDDQKYP